MMSERAGLVLLHPVALASLALWALNDHVLKALWPGALTGKLSDASGLTVCPLLAIALFELTCPRASERAHRIAGWIALAAVGGTLAGIKTIDWMGDAYQCGLAALQWPVRALLAQTILPLGRVALARDPTDLWTLPSLLIPAWLIMRPCAATSSTFAPSSER